MKKFVIIIIFLNVFASCTYQKGGITDKMKTGLISFKQETIGYAETENTADGTITENKSNGILILTFITEETGCPRFEGGYEIVDKTLILYYQDVNFQLVKCIDLFKLEYQIKDENLEYEKIKVKRLKPIKKGLNFK